MPCKKNSNYKIQQLVKDNSVFKMEDMTLIIRNQVHIVDHLTTAGMFYLHLDLSSQLQLVRVVFDQSQVGF